MIYRKVQETDRENIYAGNCEIMKYGNFEGNAKWLRVSYINTLDHLVLTTSVATQEETKAR